MESAALSDRAGRRRSPATTSSFHQGLAPRNKGRRYPPAPPTVEEIIAMMRSAGDEPDGLRLRGVIVMLWRAGLRISEALSLNETDLDPDRGGVLIRHGKGDKRREVGMDRWAWAQLEPWLGLRGDLPPGALFCVLRGPTRGGPCAPAGIRCQLHHAARHAGVRRRFAPHQYADPLVKPTSTRKCAEYRCTSHLDRHNAGPCDRPSRSAPQERSAAPVELRRGGRSQLEQRANRGNQRMAVPPT